MNATPRHLLETKGLPMHFGGVVALSEVDLRLREGQLRCLIGPNGAGKSTFFKCLTGQLRPTSGLITFDDADLVDLPSHEIARMGIGIKTQMPSLFNGLTARENIWLAACRRHTGAPTSHLVDDTLKRLGIEDLAASVVGELAHGQRQLIELATMLGGEPNLILLDEPAAGMTNEETGRVAAIIKELNRSAALIVVEHDIQFIRLIAKTVTVFHQGRILIEDEVDAVMSNPTVRDVYLGKRVVH